ncbi:MAG: Gmad2 immunoglobulin-like domain-containing protein [Tumebacillaceae bacterium]
MKKRIMYTILLSSALFMLGGCDIGSNTSVDSQRQPQQPTQQPPQKQNPPAQNEAFQIAIPLPGQQVGSRFTVQGKARVFEAQFRYQLVAGGKVLAEGTAKADQGAPEWGNFAFEVHYSGVANAAAELKIFEMSAKDGSPVHVLSIPLQLQGAN